MNTEEIVRHIKRDQNSSSKSEIFKELKEKGVSKEEFSHIAEFIYNSAASSEEEILARIKYAEIFTPVEQEYFNNWIKNVEQLEMLQAQDLISSCNITFQFAKTHSVYVKDWEKTKKQMEDNLKNGILPPGISENLFSAIISSSDEVMQRKFKKVRDAFEHKFGESIYNYLGPDGKTKKIFGIFG